MDYEFGFLFGKTVMPNDDLELWLAVDRFSEAIQDLVSNSKPISDAEILVITERILNENLNSDLICGIAKRKLVDSVVNLHRLVDEYSFKPAWLRERFPTVWAAVKRRMANGKMVIMPTQMGRYVQVLKYVLNLAEGGIADVYVGGIDDQCVGHVTVSFSKLILKGTKRMDELFGRLRFCDSIDIESSDNRIAVSLTVPNLMMREEDFLSRNRPKKAWVLQWNKEFNQGGF